MCRLVVLALAVVAGCAFKGSDNPGDDQGDDVADDAGDDGAAIDADPADPDAAPPPDAFIPNPVTTTFGERPTSEHTGVTLDTYLDAFFPDEVFEDAINIRIDGGGQPATGLLRFDLTAIPGGATITAVSLDVHTNSSGGGDAMDLFVMNQPWTAAATWNTAGSEPWATEGAGPPSRAEVVVGSIGASADDTGYTTAITISVVQGWVNDPDSNRGFALVVEGNTDLILRASDSTVVADRPQLTVTYQPPAI